MAKAKELVFSARFVEAEEALALGLVNHVVEDDELMAKTETLAADLAEAPTFALGLAKKLFTRRRPQPRQLSQDREPGAAAAAHDRRQCRRRRCVQGKAETEVHRPLTADWGRVSLDTDACLPGHWFHLRIS